MFDLIETDETFNDIPIKCYKVLTGEWRAYLKGYAHLQAWGCSRELAISHLLKALGEIENPPGV